MKTEVLCIDLVVDFVVRVKIRVLFALRKDCSGEGVD